MIIVM